ncbi:hypothetical protein BH20ACT11_BH20ACT11_11090 [soil metagenome]
MEKARLTVDVDPELRRRIRVAAAVRDESLKEWIERALLRELEEEAGSVARVPESMEVRDYYAATGPKPGGGEGRRPQPKSGRSVSEAIIEDRG